MIHPIQKLAGILLITLSCQAAAQKKLPVLNANTPYLTIKEGQAVYKDIWKVNPEYKPDIYVPHAFQGEKRVTFYSDSDSLSFLVKPDRKYDFIVLLNGKDKALTRISTVKGEEASLPLKLTYTRVNNSIRHNDTIPFELGEDNRIYVYGTINGSDTLRLLFDLNAGANVITSEAVDQGDVVVTADGNQDNIGSDGVKNVETSSVNKIKINDLLWDRVPLLIIPYGQRVFDGVLSWRLFEDKILAIDYDKQILVVHNSLPDILSSGYTRTDMKMIGGIPYIWCQLSAEGTTAEGWFGFDTGANGELSISQQFASQYGLNGLMKQTGVSKSTGSSGITHSLKVVRLPQLSIGGYVLYRLPLSIHDKDPEGVENNEIIGNNILKRFNTVIDFRHDHIYLIPNKWLYSGM